MIEWHQTYLTIIAALLACNFASITLAYFAVKGSRT